MSSSSSGDDQPGLNTGPQPQHRRPCWTSAAPPRRTRRSKNASRTRSPAGLAACASSTSMRPRCSRWIAWNLGWLGLRALRSDVRDPRHRGLGRGHLPVDLHPHQPEPLVSRRRAPRRARPARGACSTEHEVTRILQMIAPMAERLGVDGPQDRGLEELQTRHRAGKGARQDRADAKPDGRRCGQRAIRHGAGHPRRRRSGDERTAPAKVHARDKIALLVVTFLPAQLCRGLLAGSVAIWGHTVVAGATKRVAMQRASLAHLSILVSGTRKRYARTVTIVILARQGRVTFK